MDALWKRFGLMVVSTVIGSSLALVGATASSATDAVATSADRAGTRPRCGSPARRLHEDSLTTVHCGRAAAGPPAPVR
jgi:hypothetical protein